MKDKHAICLTVNGRRHELAVEARRTLADMLRHDLGYTGTHLGCEHGICGACTVLLDGSPVRACLVFGVQADGASVRTVEGLAEGPDGQLSDLQQAFSDHHALQCGFCTPGFLMLAEAYLADPGEAEDGRAWSEERARELVASNLCRCTGYQGIIEAIVATARARARSRPSGGTADGTAGGPAGGTAGGTAGGEPGGDR
jgi:aerobic-type carbon monoxide dehydrogenase small subunit (CoxS/CutS family)